MPIRKSSSGSSRPARKRERERERERGREREGRCRRLTRSPNGRWRGRRLGAIVFSLTYRIDRYRLPSSPSPSDYKVAAPGYTTRHCYWERPISCSPREDYALFISHNEKVFFPSFRRFFNFSWLLHLGLQAARVPFFYLARSLFLSLLSSARIFVC